MTSAIRKMHEALQSRAPVQIKLYHKRLLVVLWVLQLCQEYGSSFIFLWPLNHHCEGQPDLTFTERDFRNKVISNEGLRLFWVPNLGDPKAVAEAQIRGIHLDDIEQCYMYPIINSIKEPISIDYKNLTNCQFGIEFEHSKTTLSVVAHFELACSRQWLKVLLPQSLGFGFLLGILFTWWPNRNVKTNSMETNKSSLSPWLLNQLFALALISFSTLRLNQSYTSNNKVGYIHLLTCIASRSFIVGSSFTRLFTIWKLEPSLDSKKRNSWHIQLAENQIYLFLFFSIYISFQVLHEPLILHLFTNWVQINKWLNLSSGILLIFMVLYELCARLIQLDRSDKLTINTTDQSSTRDDSGMNLQVPNEDSMTFLDNDTADTTMHQSERARSVPISQAITTRVCEFCLINEPSINAVVSMNHRVELGACDRNRSGAPTQRLTAIEVDESLVDTYRPTTVPLNASCHQLAASRQITSPLPTWTQNVVSLSAAAATPVAHTGAIHQTLFANKLLLFKLRLLAFSLAFNYFLFRLLPDHRLLHPESQASLAKRKEDYIDRWRWGRKAHSNVSDIPFLGTYYQLNGIDNGTTLEPLETVALANTPGTNSSQSPFDYSNDNFNTQSLGLLQNSYNPFMIIWTTIEINIWPIELAALLLHIGRLSNFGQRYLVLKYLFTLVKFGARLLVVEWIFIAIIRNQNHIIELDWLFVLLLTVARLAATLMLYNHFYTMIKLSRKLGTTRLVKFAPNASAITLALCLASMSPIWERLQLVLIPAALILNNSLVYLLSERVNQRFQQSLCPLMFEDQN